MPAMAVACMHPLALGCYFGLLKAQIVVHLNPHRPALELAGLTLPELGTNLQWPGNCSENGGEADSSLHLHLCCCKRKPDLLRLPLEGPLRKMTPAQQYKSPKPCEGFLSFFDSIM
jgi:hypothetical protein